MKLKGPIEKEDPNAVRKKLSPKALEQIEKRASEDSGKGNIITEFGDKTVEEDQHSITCNGNNCTSSTQSMKPVKINEKSKGAQEPKAQTAGAFPEACLGVLLLPPGRGASPSQGYPPAVCRRYPFIHLGEGRQSGVKFLL